MQMRALVANVSHDMRTPLTSILGFAQALRGGVIKGEEESKHAGDVIYDEVAKLSERLERFAVPLGDRGRAGAAPARGRRPDRARGVGDRANRRRRRARHHALAATWRRASALLPTGRSWSAPSRTCSATPASSPRPAATSRCARVQTDRRQPASKSRTPRRTSTEDEIPKLFERFYRRDAARAGKSAGSGLGLPIARDLAELHGGTLEAHLSDGMIAFRMAIPRPAPSPSGDGSQ